jgi:hypothetical protein
MHLALNAAWPVASNGSRGATATTLFTKELGGMRKTSCRLARRPGAFMNLRRRDSE